MDFEFKVCGEGDTKVFVCELNLTMYYGGCMRGGWDCVNV